MTPRQTLHTFETAGNRFKFGNCTLQVVDVYKCLGLFFDEFVTLDYSCKPLLDTVNNELHVDCL